MRATSFILAIFIAVTARAADITFSDGTFTPGNWTVTIFGTGTVDVSQQLSGGNPGAFRQITNNVDGIMWGYHMNNSATYNPSTQGAILSIDYAEDSIVLAGGGNFGAGPALMQGGRVFARPFAFSNSTWTHRTLTGMDEDNFVHWHGEPGGALPNFSATGGPITFGFWNGNADGTYSMTTAIDNWSMTLHTKSVPEPAVLAAAAFAAMALLRRRRSHVPTVLP
jgi:hypothetical protein